MAKISGEKGDGARAERVDLGFGGLSASVGDHIGHFYNTKQEWRDLLAPFLKAGLQAGDKCVYVMSPGPGREELKQGLASVGVRVEDVFASGQLIIEDGKSDPKGMQDALDSALADIPGRFDLLRWGGDMTWSLKKLPTSEKLMEWETHCNVIKNPRAVFLCQYDLSNFRGDVVLDALKTHPLCIVSNVIHQNPYYVKPEALLDELRHRVSEPLAR